MRVPLVAVLALSTACVGATVGAGVSTAQAQPYPDQYQYPNQYPDQTYYSGGVSAQVSIGDFQTDLAPYGQWISPSSYGASCWQPSQSVVGYEFQPYVTGGSWVWTDAGWQFESDLPFGWATFHYGRWLNDPQAGWCWVPDTQWAPSWVTWRFGEGFVGWAPLPPARWAYRWRQEPWVFVDAPHFVARDVWRYRLGPRDYHRAYTVTRPIAPPAGRPYVVGPPPQQIARYVGRPVPTAPPVRGRPPPGGTRPWMRQRSQQEVAPTPPAPVQPPAAPVPPPGSRVTPPPPAAQPPPAPPAPPQQWDRGQGRNEPPGSRPWERERERQPISGPPPVATPPQPPPPAAPPQPPSVTPPPPAAQPPPAAPEPPRVNRGQGRNEPPGPRPGEREREQRPPSVNAPPPPPAAPPPPPPAAPPPRAMPQPPVATPPQGMPPAPPQPRPPEARGQPPAAPPPAAEPKAKQPERRRGPPEKKDPDERKEERRREKD